MTMIKDLIANLQTRNPNAQVFFMTTRKQPFENRVAGIVGRHEMADQLWRIEPGIAHDDVFLVVGTRLRPGSLSAWIVAEHQAATAAAVAETPVTGADDRMAAALADIARQHLRLDSLEDAEWDSADFSELATGDVRRALEAAYLAGRAAREGGADTDTEVEAEQPVEAEPELPRHE